MLSETTVVRRHSEQKRVAPVGRPVPMTAMFLLLAVGAVHGQNVTSATALGIAVGQPPVPAIIGQATPERWFAAHTEAGRSYCFELARRGDDENDDFHPPGGEQGVVGTVTVYRADAQTPLAFGSGDTVAGAQHEPYGAGLGRACFVQPVDQREGAVNTVLVKVASAPAGAFFVLRGVETTRFCNWRFSAGDFRSFLVISNRTSTAWQWLPTVTVDGGTLPLAINRNLNPNEGAAFELGPLGAAGGGSLTVAHPVAMDALGARIITMSPQTGVSWTTECGVREPW